MIKNEILEKVIDRFEENDQRILKLLDRLEVTVEANEALMQICKVLKDRLHKNEQRLVTVEATLEQVMDNLLETERVTIQ